MGEGCLVLEGLSKSYRAVRAVDNVSFTCRKKEIVGLIGHNGAGKSTVSKLIAGIIRADSGRIVINGKEVRLRNSEDGIRAGVGLVPQKLEIVPNLTVKDNLLLGYRKFASKKDLRSQDGKVTAVAAELGIEDVLETRADRLTPAVQRLLMIARALLRNPSVLILDEPTAAFSEDEVAKLFEKVRELSAKGIATLFVSHRIDDVLRLTDRVVAMSQGSVVADVPTSELSKERLADLMAGRHVEHVVSDGAAAPAAAKSPKRTGDAVFTCKGLHAGEFLEGIDFELYRGEIVGLTGLVGSGRTSLLNTICGLGVDPDVGEITVQGDAYQPKNMAYAIRRGIGYLPENRGRNSVIPAMSVRENVSLPSTAPYRRKGSPLLNTRLERKRVGEMLDTLKVRPQGAMDLRIEALSGGNQQKCLFARWLLLDIDVLLLDEPTEGVDIQGREDIYQFINEAVSAGKGVLMSSSDLEEVVEQCDRVLVMQQGRITDEVKGPELTLDRVSKACVT